MGAFNRVVFLVIAAITASPTVSAESPIELSCDLSSTSGSNREESQIDERIYVTITPGEQDEVRVEVYRAHFDTPMILEGSMSGAEVNAVRRGDPADRILGGVSEVLIMINRESGDVMVISTWETEGKKSVVFKYGVCKAASCSRLLELCDDRFSSVSLTNVPGAALRRAAAYGVSWAVAIKAVANDSRKVNPSSNHGVSE